MHVKEENGWKQGLILLFLIKIHPGLISEKCWYRLDRLLFLVLLIFLLHTLLPVAILLVLLLQAVPLL